jgi:2-polyprenyl-6-hydroxyphenyl methylase / 3-demethylubiquinone-9 3-methyltransferase
MNQALSPDELKSLYGEEYVNNFLRKQSVKRISTLLPLIELKSDYHVADFGCGSGMLMPLVAPTVATYTGVDFSETFIHAAQQLTPVALKEKVQFHCATIQDFCATHANTYDAGFAMDFSEHVYDDDWKDILISIYQSLKPGGKLYIHTPNAQFLIEAMKQRNFILQQFPEHIAVRNIQQNTALLEAAGFSITSLRRLPHYVPLLKPLHLLSFLPWIGKYFKARIFIVASK